NCNLRTCRKKIAVKHGTWFSDSRLEFVTAIRFIYCWSEELVSINFCEKQLQISHNTSVDWCNFMMEMCVGSMEHLEAQKIGGPGRIVEIDESLFSKRKNHCGRVLPPVWIFGGVCRETGECFLQAVPNRGFKTLTSVILERIEEGSTIYSDCWRSYKTSELEAQGFEHFRVNHKYNFVDPESGAHTQTVERMWGSAKWRNKKQRGTDRNMLDSYLAEFIWRKNNRENDLFIKALQDIAALWPPEENDFGMIAEPHATSKIRKYEDLTAIQTYGFRGRALNSLCSSSKLTVLIRAEGNKGYQLGFDNTGKYLPEETKEITKTVGTEVIVTNFMCHSPVRRKALQRKKKAYIDIIINVVKVLQDYALARIDSVFELSHTNNGKTTVLMKTPANNAQMDRVVRSVFPNKGYFLNNNMVKLKDVDISETAYDLYKLSKVKLDLLKVNLVKVEGYISMIENIENYSLDYIFLFVNKRQIKNQDIKAGVKRAYPRICRVCDVLSVMHITIPSIYLDVNSSPLKDQIECTIMDLVLARFYSCVDAAMIEKISPNTCDTRKVRIDDSEGLNISRNRKLSIDKNVNDETFKKPDLSNHSQVPSKFSLKALKEYVKSLSQQETPSTNSYDTEVVFREENEKGAEEELKRYLKKDDFAKVNVIGQFDYTFILCQNIQFD
uniref:DDE_Tnp_IS1595 domain-containing protein n=1 Tax=Strongyloides papillosus TaxID=174720 RepID=A0A0N5BKW6_STREA